MARVFALLVCLLSVAACAPATPAAEREPWRTDTEVVTVQLFEPDTIDPQKVSFANEMSIAGMLYEPLLTWDPTALTLMPAAARSLPRISQDGRVYTYTLRDGLVYSDGSPLLAQRFVDSFVRACDPAVYGEYAFLAYPIVGCQELNLIDPKKADEVALVAARARVAVRALDAFTIEFTLREPNAAFPQVTAMPLGSPVRVEDVARWVDGYRAARDPGVYVGNGPFIFKEWVRGERLVFERNERYRSPTRVARWTKRIVPDADTARVLYDAGRIDAVSVAPRDKADREALLTRSDLVRTLGTCTRYVGFNTQRAPFDDANVRLAFAKAIDKSTFASDVMLSHHVAPSFPTHDFPGHAHDDRVQDFDPAGARRLLAASSYGPPVGGRIGNADLKFTFNFPSFTTPASKATRDRVMWIIDQWARNLGVVVQPDPVDTNTYGTLVKKPLARPLLQWMSWCADYPDGDAWYMDFLKNGPAANALAFADPEYDALVARAKVEHDSFMRARLYQAASHRLSSDAPGAWLSWNENWWLVRPELKGHELSSFDRDFAQLSLARIVGVKR